jgi:hypothetical protein
LRNQDDGAKQFAQLRVLDSTIEGWAIWNGDEILTISIDTAGENFTTLIEPDAFHPLAASDYHAAGFNLARPKSRVAQLISLAAGGDVFYSARVSENCTVPATLGGLRTVAPPASAVTVIVPVYGDFEATKTCLDGLLLALEGNAHRAIIVDDATPDTRIANYLGQIRSQPKVNILHNEANLGFAGAVNRALGRFKAGDVILLNSDTEVPRGFIDRLSAAA